MILRIIPVVILAFALAACSPTLEDTDRTGGSSTETVVDMAEEPTETASVQEATIVAESMASTDVPTDVPSIATVQDPTPETSPVSEIARPYNGPVWTNIQLVNAATGETFTLADLAGRTVFVEPMATWCSNCRRQQGFVAEAMRQLDPESYVFISLSVGENISNEVLASYAQRNAFPQVFVVAPQELVSALVEAMGFTVTTPPSTPHFTISPTGVVSDLYTGYHEAQAIIDDVTRIQNG